MARNGIAFLLSLGAALGLTFLLAEPDFTASQSYVLFLLFFALALWLTEAIPSFSVGLFILAFLVFALGNPRFNPDPEPVAKYVNTFSSGVIWLLLGGFFLASAMTKARLDVRLLRATLKLSGSSPRRVLLGLMLATVTVSTMMSNTAAAAMVISSVMPLLTHLGKGSKLARGILVGITIGATTGGMGIIIGTPPNAIAVGALENAGITVDFVEWMAYGMPLALLLTGAAYLLLAKLYVKEESPITTDFLDKEDEAPVLTPLQRWIVIATFILTVTLWMTSALHNVSVSAVSAIPIVFLTMSGVLGEADMRKLPWDTLLLIAGALSLGLALQETGLLTHYAGKFITMGLDPVALIAVLGFATMVFSNIMSHTATSTVLIPLGMAVLPGRELEVALVIALSSSMALFLPVSTPPNAVAFATGLLDQKDFRPGGVLFGLLGTAAVIGWVLYLN